MFDPYHKWLGIPRERQPPTFYQLLGISPQEDDREVIEEAAIRQTSYLRQYQTGPHAQECARLLGEVAQARLVLLNPSRRQAYDERLSSTTIKKASDETSTRITAIATDAPDWAGMASASGPASQPKLPALAGPQAPKPKLLLFGGAGLVSVVIVGVLLFSGSKPAAENPNAPSAKSPGKLTTPPASPVTFLSDLTELRSSVGHGMFGKRGELSYEIPTSGATRIVIKGRPWRRGLSMHPPSDGSATVVYGLEKRYKTLAAAAAIMAHPDHLEGSTSLLTFEVLGDGKSIWKSPAMQRSDDPREFRVEIGGIDQLELRVDCSGVNHHACAVWLDPRVQ
jgi:hypothetical protein